jgi:hypothetical protein
MLTGQPERRFDLADAVNGRQDNADHLLIASDLLIVKSRMLVDRHMKCWLTVKSRRDGGSRRRLLGSVIQPEGRHWF